MYGEVDEFERALSRPFFRRSVVLFREQFRRGGFFKSLDAGNSSERRFQLRPREDDALEIETQIHHVYKRNTKEGGVELSPEDHSEDNEQNGENCDHEVEHESEPSLDAVEKIGGLLGVVEKGQVFVRVGDSPAKGADCSQAVDRFEEVRV